MTCWICNESACEGECILTHYYYNPAELGYTSSMLEDADSAGIPGTPGPRPLPLEMNDAKTQPQLKHPGREEYEIPY